VLAPWFLAEQLRAGCCGDYLARFNKVLQLHSSLRWHSIYLKGECMSQKLGLPHSIDLKLWVTATVFKEF
jgi:hypothetical protein